MRNKIINGKMEVAQRGTSFAAIADGAYALDRWVFGNSSAAVVTASQQSDAPSNNEFLYSLRLAVTTADTSIAAGDQAAIQQRLEGFNSRDLIGRTFTMSFWVRSTKTGTHCVSFRNSVADRSYVVEYTVNVTNTWEKKSVTVVGGLVTAGTWNWTTGIGVSVAWALAAGTTFQTTAGAWQTGNFLGTANQVNCLDSTANIFAITGVQIEVGATATPFEHRNHGLEQALCQRYYETNTKSSFYISGIGGLSVVMLVPEFFKVTKRATPVVGIGTATGRALDPAPADRPGAPHQRADFCGTGAACPGTAELQIGCLSGIYSQLSADLLSLRALKKFS
jgi:hypothetical protein